MGRDAKTQELVDRIRTTIDDAKHSRPGSREAIRALMDEHPSMDLLEGYGDAAGYAERALVEAAAGDNVLVGETTGLWVTKVRNDLAEPGDTKLEEMLVYRVALCWLAVNTAEWLRAGKWKGGISTESANFWDRHVSRVQSDYLRACRTLATVRKLRRPTVQMNVAQQQVNVAT